MTKLKSVDINCTTGEVIETPYTEEELQELIVLEAQLEAEAEERRNAKAAEEAAKAAAKASAEAKLAELGLTPEEIAALR
jgi:hypothetical protein